MNKLLLLLCVLSLVACGSKGPPIPDWKTDSSNYIERYKKTYLMGENILATSHFERAINATAGAGKVAETARLWLIQCALHKAVLETDSCAHYEALAKTDTTEEDRAYFKFLTGQWERLDEKKLPAQYATLIKSAPAGIAKSNEAINAITDPLSRLIGVGVLMDRKLVDDATLSMAARTASDQGWRRPLLVYLKLQYLRAREQGNTEEQIHLGVQINLVEESLNQTK